MGGNKLFGIDVAKLIHKNISKGVLPATLQKKTVAARTTGSLTSGKVTTYTDYTCRGFIETYDDNSIDGTIILKEDRKITIIGDSIQSSQIPAKDDRIVIEGSTFTIIRISGRDPAAATYILQGR